MLEKIQTFDPIGVGARNLAECMLIQAMACGQDDDLVVKMIRSHLGNLEKKNYQAIARDLKQPLEEIYEAAKVIMDFDPRPGRQYSTDDPHYITPDVYIHKVGDKYFVVPNDDGLPKLKISGFYKNAMGNSAASKDYVQDKLRSRAVADPLDPAAPAHDHQGRRVDPEVPARVLRQGHRAPEAADPPRRRRGHRHARVDRLARDDQQVRPHAAGHLRAEVLLQLAASRAPTARTSRRRP